MSLQATKLHAALKLTNKTLQYLKHSPTPDPTQINRNIQRINKLSDLEITFTQPIETNKLINELKVHKRTIWAAQNHESKQQLNERINFYMTRRYQDFTDNTCGMLDSILNRRNDPVCSTKIRLEDKLITEEDDIKRHFSNHFKNWTKKNPQTIIWNVNRNKYMNQLIVSTQTYMKRPRSV